MTDNAQSPEPATAPDPNSVPPGAPAEEPGKPPLDGAPKKDRAQERIEELIALNKQEREAMAEYAEHWRRLALAKSAPPAEVTPPAEDPMPTLDKFDSTEKWAAAYAAWNDRQLDKRAATVVEQRLAAARQAESRQAVLVGYHERLAAFEKTTPDARITINNPTMTAALQQQPVIGEVIMASELGPQVAYHLSKNPLELIRIARLPGPQAAAAIGRVEAELRAATKAPKPPAPPQTRAPEPPSPIDGGGSPSIDLEKCSLEEFLAIRIGKKR